MLVAAGGYADGDRTLRALASVEGLSVASGSLLWVPLPPLHSPRLWAAAATADGSTVYVLGGSCDGKALASVERWNVGASNAECCWEVLPAMNVPREATAAVAA